MNIIERAHCHNEPLSFKVAENVMITRQFTPTYCDKQENSFSLYTYVRKVDQDKDAKAHASVVIVHGNSEHSDNFLEVAIHHAMNNLKVHLIDLKGQGLSSGERGGHYKIQDHHLQIATMLTFADPSIPCFIQAHSMGCLDTVNFLINNPQLKIAGVIAGSPFWGLSATHNIGVVRRLIVKLFASFLEELPINNAGSMHHLSHDKQYYVHEMAGAGKKHAGFSSGGIINSMFESCEDISVNAKLYSKPTLVFLAGKDFIVNNDASRLFLRKCGIPAKDKIVVEMPGCYHNIHKEKDFKFK